MGYLIKKSTWHFSNAWRQYNLGSCSHTNLQASAGRQRQMSGKPTRTAKHHLMEIRRTWESGVRRLPFNTNLNAATPQRVCTLLLINFLSCRLWRETLWNDSGVIPTGAGRLFCIRESLACRQEVSGERPYGGVLKVVETVVGQNEPSPLPRLHSAALKRKTKKK